MSRQILKELKKSRMGKNQFWIFQSPAAIVKLELKVVVYSMLLTRGYSADFTLSPGRYE